MWPVVIFGDDNTFDFRKYYGQYFRFSKVFNGQYCTGQVVGLFGQVMGLLVAFWHPSTELYIGYIQFDILAPWYLTVLG